MSLGLCCLTAAKATTNMAEKLRQACMKACSSPLTRRWSRRSHSLALPNSLSTLTRFLKRLTRRLAPWTTKSRPTFKACLILELLRYGMTGSAPNILTVSLTFRGVVLGVSQNGFSAYALTLQLLQQRFNETFLVQVAWRNRECQ